MVGKLVCRLLGADRFKHRGDRFFLANDFTRALSEYRRARAALASTDYRAATLDALIRECAHRSGALAVSETLGEDEGEPPGQLGELLPGLGELFELAIAEKSPERIRAYRELGQSFQGGYVALVQGDAETSVRLFEQAARKSPSSFLLQLEWGRALSLADQMDSARAALTKAYQMRPSDPELLNLLAAVNIQLGRYEEATRLIEPLAKKDDIGPETMFLLGKSLASAGRGDQALGRFRQTVEIDARFHEAYFEAAKILEQRGEYEKAQCLLEQACSLAPDEPAYNLALVRLVLEHELEEEVGLAACDRLMVTDEDHQWRYLAWIAELYVRHGWKREAQDPLRKALRLIPRERTHERLELEQRLIELESRLST